MAAKWPRMAAKLNAVARSVPRQSKDQPHCEPTQRAAVPGLHIDKRQHGVAIDGRVLEDCRGDAVGTDDKIELVKPKRSDSPTAD